MEPHEKIEFELAADNIMNLLPMLLGMYGPMSQALKGYFDELVKAGFSESQALHIVATQGITARLDGGNNK